MFSAKTLEVLSNLSAKTAALQEDNGLTSRQEAASAARGLPLTGPTNGQDDYSWMTRPSEDTAGFAGAFNSMNMQQTAPRPFADAVRDTVVSVGSGAVQGATSLLSIPDNLLFRGNLGTAGFASDTAEVTQNLLSRQMREQNEVYGQLSEAEGRDADRRGITGFARIIEDINDTGSLVGANLNQVPQGVANAAGSFLLGGAVSKGLSLGIRGAVAASRSAAVARFAQRFGDDVAGALGMGSMEAGGAGLQASQAVNGMSHEQLLAGSDFYGEYLARHGDTAEAREAAKRAIGADAANMAALVQAPAALLGGALTARIARSPFSAGTVRDSLANIGKEALEEAVQEGAGNFSSNLGVRTFADRNQALEQGVGRGIVEGGLYGGLSVGTMQTPGTIARRGIERTAETLTGIQARGNATNNANVVAQREAVGETVAAAAAPVVAPEINPEIQDDADMAEFRANIDDLNILGADLQFSPAEFSARNETEAALMAEVDPVAVDNVFKAMESAVAKMSDENTTPEQRIDLAIFVSELQNNVKPESFTKLQELKDKANPGGTLARELKLLDLAHKGVADNELYKATLLKALEGAPEVTVADVEDISTPEGQRAFKQVVLGALVSPETADPEVLERLFRHSSSGTGSFTPTQTFALRSAVALNQTVKAAAAKAEALGLDAPEIASVAKQIQDIDPDAKGSFKAGLSVKSHYANVNALGAQGGTAGVKEALTDFQSFAQHMANKLSAVNESWLGREGPKGFNPDVTFEAYNPTTRTWAPSAKPITIPRFKEGPIAFGQQVGVDAEYVIDAYNALVQAYPDMGMKPVEAVRMDNSLKAGRARKLFEEARKESDAIKRGLKPAEQNQDKQPEPKTETVKAAAPVETVSPKIEDTKTQEPVVEDIKDASLETLVALLKEVQELKDEVKFERVAAELRVRKLEAEAAPSPVEAVEVVAEPKAQPEVTTTEETAVEKTKTLSMRESFSNLVRSEADENLFTDGFIPDNEAKTALMGEDAISILEIEAALQDNTKLRALKVDGSKLNAEISAAYASVFSALKTAIIPTMLTELFAPKPDKKGVDQNLLRRHLNGEPMKARGVPLGVDTVALRLLSIMERDDKAGLKMNPVVLSAAMAAMGDWLAQNSVSKPRKDKEAIAKALGLDISQVTDTLAYEFNKGNLIGQTRLGLMSKLEQYLGLIPEADTPLGLSRGVLLSLASSLIEAAVDSGYIVDKQIYLPEEKKNFRFVSVNKEKLGLVKKGEEGTAFKGQTTLIDQIVRQEQSVAGYTVGTPSARRSSKLLKGGAPLTAEEEATQVRENKVPNTVNSVVRAVYKLLDKEGVRAVFANGLLPPTLNKNDALSKESQNNSMDAAYDAAMGLAQQLEDFASENDLTLEEAQVFFEYEFSSVNRMQQQGAYGPQASKLTRELITPTVSDLDLSDPKSTDYSMWRRTLAQALGIKVELKFESEWNAELQKKLDAQKIQDVLELLVNTEAVTSDELVAALQDAGINKPTQVHALISYAQYLNAKSEGTLSSFKTHMYIEADGKTDGPTQSLIFLRLLGFSPELIKALRRGGVAFSRRAISLPELFATGEQGGKMVDAYEATAKLTAKYMESSKNALIKNARDPQAAVKLNAHYAAFKNVMQTLIGDPEDFSVSEEDGKTTFVIGRSQLKNPMTITVYGSGADGIAAKIASELVSKLYEQISVAHADATEEGMPKNWGSFLFYDDAYTTKQKELEDSLRTLATKEITSWDDGKGAGRKYYVRDLKESVGIPNFVGSSAKDYTIPASSELALSKAIKDLYVAPMVKAIEEQMGSSIQGSKLVQQSTNMMSALAKTAFNKFFADKMKGRNLGQGLSPNELKKLFTEVAWLLPYMEGDSITVNVKGKQDGTPKLINDAGDQRRMISASTYKGNVDTELMVPMPAIAGVAAGAFVNISYGDGRMIIKASKGLMGGRLHIFDGINLPVKNAYENGIIINKAFLESIETGTPFKDLLKSFKTMADTLELQKFDSDEIVEIFKIVRGKDAKPAEGQSEGSVVYGDLQSFVRQLEEAAIDEEARQFAYSKFDISSDHMGAISAPASTEGRNDRIDLEGKTDDEIAEALNAVFLDKRKELRGEADAKVEEEISPAFKGFPKDANGVHVTNTGKISSLLSSLNLPAQQRLLIQRAGAVLNGSWTVVIGSKAAANRFAKVEGIPHRFGKDDFGLALPGRKTLIVANGSSETLAHEMIHAATIDRVEQFYADPASLDDTSRGAITRLEALQGEWLAAMADAFSLRKETPELTEAIKHAKAAVEGLLAKGDQAGALNEFMAWNLSNQNLVKLNSTIKVESKLARIKNDVITALRKLFKLPPLGSDLNSQIVFNSLILMDKKLPTFKSEIVDRMLFHSSGTRSDLDYIGRQFASLVSRVYYGPFQGTGADPATFAIGIGEKLATIAEQNGFSFTPEERVAFAQVIAAYRVNQVIDPQAQVRLDAYYTEVLAQMTEQNMMENAAANDPNDKADANKRMDLLRNQVLVGNDVEGRTLLLPMFIALGATNSQAQKFFGRMTVRNKKLGKVGTTFDQVITEKAKSLIERLMNASYSMKPGQNVSDEILKVVEGIVRNVDRQQTLMDKSIETPMNITRNLNERTSNFVASGLDIVSIGADKLIAKAQGTKFEDLANGPLTAAKYLVNVLDKNKYEEMMSRLALSFDQMDMHPEFRGLLNDFMGANEDNINILGLVKKGRAIIDQIRQAYRKGLPQEIAKKFTRTLTPQEWAAQHQMGQADLASLIGQGLSDGDVIDLLSDPAALSAQLNLREAAIRKAFGANANVILAETRELADLMSTKKGAHGLVKRNALAIANRAGETNVGTFTFDSAETRAIDAYVSLMALARMAPSDRATLSELAKTEKEGMRYTLSLMAQARANEMKRVPDRLKYNIQKGYIPAERLGSFKAVPFDKVNQYTKTGYRIVGSRQSGPIEDLFAPVFKSTVYVATDLTAPAFKQGIMRTIRSTVFGLDAVTGLSYDNPSAGMISKPKEVAQITAALKSKKQDDNTLSPLYNEKGQIYAYERRVPIDIVEYSLKGQENAAVALGQWIGRQYEEVHAQELNNILIERLAKDYEDAKRQGVTDAFFDLAELAKTDPVVADAMALIGDMDMKSIYSRMDGKFMVRKGLYENVIGYRSISVTDFWSGNTRLSTETQEAFADFLTGVMGPKAYRYLLKSEQSWEKLMGDARVAIVVKSMLVPGLNAAANFYQLMANGIGPVEIARKSAEKVRETHYYAQNQLEQQRLMVELAAARGAGRTDVVSRIETQMVKLEDINRRLSIWPLIEAGEFSQVTEGLTQEDMELTDGRVWDYVEKLADKLPKAVKTAGRYAIVAKDTALFAGLAKTVMYTDFVAKAVLYDHLVRVQKLDQPTALLRITNEFVNYDLLGGRIRSKGEAAGFVWFWAFKTRSVKVAASLLRHNPLHTLLSSMVPGSYEVGTVMDDNAVNLIFDDRFKNAFGFENAWRAVDLNWVRQLFG